MVVSQSRRRAGHNRETNMGHRVKYELIYIDEGDTRGWYAQSHCDCGSSLSSGEVHPEAFDAINICSENIANHIRENASGRCGNKNHQADTTAYAIGEAEAKVLFDAADAQAELDQVKSPTRQQLERFDELISQALTVLRSEER